MRIIKEALAGTFESSDLMVKVAPAVEDELEVIIQSEVANQFGAQIDRVVRETLAKLKVTQGRIAIDDKGALDCAIRARLQTAVMRGAGCTEIDWRTLS